MKWWKDFIECEKANLTGLEEQLFENRIEALQYLQKLNPKKVITYDRRCNEITIDELPAFIKFKKVDGKFRFKEFSFFDKNAVGGWDTYIN